MQKFICIFLSLILINLPASAEVISKKIYTVAYYDIDKNTIKNTSFVSLYAYGDFLINDEIKIKDGEKITLKLDEYKKAKRGKRNGYYNVTYISPLPEGKSYENNNIKGEMRLSTHGDLKEITKKAGLTAAGLVLNVPGFTQAVVGVKGIILPNENEGRLESAWENIYESTPLPYIEKGEDFNATPDTVVVIKLKQQKECENGEIK